MKKSLILILSVTTFVLFSAGFGSADDKAICPLNKSIYMSEATKEIFAVKQYARRVRYKCFEYTEKKDNEYIGRKMLVRTFFVLKVVDSFYYTCFVSSRLLTIP